MSAEACKFFDDNRSLIDSGIIHVGKFERYFRIFAKRILPLIHSRSTVLKLLSEKSATAQLEFYNKRWNTWRWRLLFRIFFSKWVMGRLGRDPEFLEEVKVPVSEFIFNRAQQHLTSVTAQHNHILRYNLTGSFGDELPHFLQPKNYELVKANMDKLVLFKGYAEAAILKYGPFDVMNLSNIFEYMQADSFRDIAAGLVSGLKNGGRIAYWNLMVPRKISAVNSSVKDVTPVNLGNMDKGFFYHAFIVERKQ